MLEWAERFSSEEAPQLMREAGKDGVIAFRPTLQRLVGLFTDAVAISRKESRNPSPGVHTLRVGNALDSVLLQLQNAQNLAKPLSRTPRPDIEAVDPTEVEFEEEKKIILRIEGENFQPKSRVRLDRSGGPVHHVEACRVHFGSSSILWATFDLAELDPAELHPDPKTESVWSAVVLNPDGTYTVLQQALTVHARDGVGANLATPPPTRGTRKPR